ncbi:uncharacterized protein PV09_05078 [Verruconis gallopava]|uniref:Uncharacterized protein n=1 Tax=Verruconis gallopava TaxID=253628 RepID=A0A0D2AAY8_9PEZI|nr:uncharacterized protein PV09_05078 [Verruconis gallopava]KIW03775.1 hypothetical protein PV09_05078 [Verruconis gallopava]
MTSKAVNVPVNEKLKEQDVNNKLQLYGIYSAFANGKVPSNQQIDVALNSFLASKALSKPSDKLSEEGKQLVADFRDVVEKAKILLLTKNEGNLLQDFIWQTQQISGGDATKPNAPIDKATAKQHGNEALEGLRTLGTLIISNGQFRKLLNDATILLRSIAGDAATKTASKVHPGEERLNQIDEPAPDNTWHDVPDLTPANLKKQAKAIYDERKPFSSKQVEEAAREASAAAHPDGSTDPAGTAQLAARDQQQGTSSGVDAVAGANAAFDKLRTEASNNVSEDTKDQARNYKARTQNYLQSKMPKERREQTIWRLKKMVVEIQGHQDYQRAIDTLLRLAEEYGGHSKTIAAQGSGAIKGAHTDDSLQLAEADLKTLIERFANGTSSDDLFDAINQIYRDADQDSELKGWFKKMDAYIRRVLKEPGYIMQDASTNDWNALYDQGQFLLRDKYRAHTDRVLDEIKFFANEFDNDPQNKAFAASMNKLFNDLGQDKNGKPTFKPHLVKDITDVILPAAFEHIRYVPIPRIEVSDPMVDAVIENLVIESDNLAPNVLEFGSDNYWRWGRKKIASKNKNKVMLSVSGVQLDLRDVAFYVKKKQGFPSISDIGVADIFMGGEGLSFKIKAETADAKDRQNFFKIEKVDVDIKNVNIKLKKSKHKILFALAKPIVLKALRPALQKAIEKQIKDAAHKLDGLLYNIKLEAEKAQADFEADPTPENAQNMWQRYVTAANKQLMQGKEKKAQLEQRAKQTKVNAAVTKHDSIFPNISLPGGISTKATEYKELARKGDKWESPVFSIGSAKETTNLPPAPKIIRKPHATAGSTTTVSTQGFSNQVDQAFGKTNGVTNGNTMLGAQNPVLNGSA